MEIKDLRIGNYVKDHLGRNLKVLGLKDDNVHLLLSNKCKVRYNIKTIQPIKLTEDILLNLGFSHFFNDDEYSDWYWFLGSFCLIGKDESNDWNFRHNTYSNCYVNYIHQFQNLYFALTNKELEINL